jgi:hemoglobin-like flavoprotein
MTPEQIRLVQTSFAQIAPISEPAAALFYGKLFELDPSLRALFTSDMTEQGRKLMQMIGVAVNSLTRLNDILPAVKQLGVRHAAYGVTDAHYDTVATALLWTLGQGLGAAFTSDTREAWIAAYGLLASTMKEAAATAAAV